MESERPSLANRAIAIVVLVVVALIAIRLAIGLVVGAISAVFWLIVVVAAVIGFFWARGTLRAAKRDRQDRRERTVRKPDSKAVTARPAEDPVEAQMRQIKEQLRDQGRL